MTQMKEPRIEFELTGMAHGGSAIGRHNGKAIFVPYAIAGETIAARIVEDKGNFARGELAEVITPSENRVEPPCRHFGKCGGCNWQHIRYEAQLEFKRQIVFDQLSRIGGIKDAVVHPTIASPDEWRYRSHVNFHRTHNGQLGFVMTDDRTVMAIEECHIIRPELGELFGKFNQQGVKPEHKRVRLQVGSESQEILAASNVGDETGSEETRTILGSGKVHYTIKGHVFEVTAGSFFQVNLPQAETLVNLVLERLALQGTEHVLDLYSGVGLFTAFLAPQARKVTAIESYPPAVNDAKVNLAKFTNIKLLQGTAEQMLTRFLQGHFDAAVIDPPRTGMKPAALEELMKCQPSKLVYVSCDPATLGRDTKKLVGSGYQLVDVQPVDMFPQTYHIESVATFIR
ncbi:MAG: 23S rRNA (uracil(1939)-C(5))-methyltransferase RlmD [Chloroflexi bacterium]|nr:23S rRNA (uracil(1939)-C(5))-methyltransferase RlmD [Chloroflexota bacterium]